MPNRPPPLHQAGHVTLDPGNATAAKVGVDQSTPGTTNAVALTDAAQLALALISAAPGSDTGQIAVPVRVISQLGGGGGSPTVTQGTAAAGSGAWPVELTEDTTNTIVKPGDSGNKAVRVNIVAGAGPSGGPSSAFAGAFPASGYGAGYFDGTNMQGARVKDADSGAGTHYTLEVILQKSASGGPVDFGTSTDPVRTDPTGTTVQPVSATALPLPATAATDARQDTGNASLASIDGKTVAPVSVAPAAANPPSVPTMPSAVVNDSPEVYIAGELRPFSMTPEGRLRVSAIAASTYLEHFRSDGPLFDVPDLTASDNPWDFGMASPFP